MYSLRVRPRTVHSDTNHSSRLLLMSFGCRKLESTGQWWCKCQRLILDKWNQSKPAHTTIWDLDEIIEVKCSKKLCRMYLFELAITYISYLRSFVQLYFICWAVSFSEIGIKRTTKRRHQRARLIVIQRGANVWRGIDIWDCVDHPIDQTDKLEIHIFGYWLDFFGSAIVYARKDIV